MRLSVLFVLLCVVYPILGWLHRCPPPENVPQKCSCEKKNDNVQVSCRRIYDSHVLSESLAYFQDYVVDTLVISDSGPLEMLSGPFRKLHIHRLLFKKVSFGNLPILDSFRGLEPILESLTFDGCKVGRWTWTGGQGFSYLKDLTFTKTALPKVLSSAYFEKFPSKIENLNIIKCDVEKLEWKALDRFKALKSLQIEDNRLTSINRTSLPSQLRRLIHLSFRGNPLTGLPEDMFAHMPRLEILMLGGTKLKTLEWKTFEPIWEQLEEVYFNGIQLKCDCDSTWLMEVDAKKMPYVPKCDSNGKRITDSTHEELCHTRRK